MLLNCLLDVSVHRDNAAVGEHVREVGIGLE